MNKKTQKILELLADLLRAEPRGFADLVRERRVGSGDGEGYYFHLQLRIWGLELTEERVRRAIYEVVSTIPGVVPDRLECESGHSLDCDVVFVIRPDSAAERPVKHTPGTWVLNSDNLSISTNPIHTDTRNHGYLPLGGSHWKEWMGETDWPLSHQEAEANARLWAASSALYDYVYDMAQKGDGRAIFLVDKIGNEYKPGETVPVPAGPFFDCQNCLQAVGKVFEGEDGRQLCSQCLVDLRS